MKFVGFLLKFKKNIPKIFGQDVWAINQEGSGIV